MVRLSLCLVPGASDRQPLRNANALITDHCMAREDFTACIAAANGNNKGSKGDGRTDADRM